MQTDPVLEWRRLSEHYRALRDEELRLLAYEFRDLTEMAQQALRSELHSRGLGDPETLAQAPIPEPIPEPILDPRVRSAAQSKETAETGEEDAENENTGQGAHDYTWKTLLCDCETAEQAWQLSEALRRAGIESWTTIPGRWYSPYGDLDLTNPRVLVAADQLDQARLIASRPIPQDIIDESREEPEEYVAPTCPGCGSADPVLESADPVNAWRCEVCGREWQEAVETQKEEPRKGGFGISAAGNGKSRPATGQLYPQGE
jgi:hypothetical protein